MQAGKHYRPPLAKPDGIKGPPPGPFQSVPFLLKDLGIEARDFPSHNGSRLFADTVYPEDSSIFARIKATGVVTFGRTTSPEGGIGAATEAAVCGLPTRNPWILDHTPGGSSGGAVASVAAGIVAIAHGSDGGGSVWMPTSSCGLFGFKPTRARLPGGQRSGEGWAGLAIDGFLTRSVRDTATTLDACDGPDLGAPHLAPPLVEGHSFAIHRNPPRLRVGICGTTFAGVPDRSGRCLRLLTLLHGVRRPGPACSQPATLQVRDWPAHRGSPCRSLRSG